MTYLNCLVEDETSGLVLLPAQSPSLLALRPAQPGDVVRFGNITLELANCVQQLCPVETLPELLPDMSVIRTTCETVQPDLTALWAAIAKARAVVD